jgi:hypothetical protein
VPWERSRHRSKASDHVQQGAWIDTLTWERWQEEVVALLRSDFDGELRQTTLDDVDWVSWKPFFIQGRSPRAAIERALERDI